MRSQHDVVPPTAMPVLARGRHRGPSEGACFMEYTALLAGEAFTDAPRCVDADLALVMRVANDRLSDADRSRLVPLLGRAIGLCVQRPVKPAGRGAWRLHWLQMVRYRALSAQLRCAASARFMAALQLPPSSEIRLLYGDGEQCGSLFWELLDDPAGPDRTVHPVDRLIGRLRLLHECYEQAMEDLGLSRRPPARPAVDRPVPSARREAEVPGCRPG
jgi:hypothetical protein